MQNQRTQLKEQRDSLNKEAKNWINEKRKKQQLIQQMKDEALKYKAARDELNSRVKEIKVKLVELEHSVSGKFKQYDSLKARIKEIKKPIKTQAQSIKEEFDDLEWKIQTTPYDPKEEKALIEQVKALESQLLLHRKLQVEVDKLNSERAEIGLVKSQIDELRSKILEVVEESRTNHQKMIEIFTKIDKLRDEAEFCHRKFLEAKSQADTAHKNYLETEEKKKELSKKFSEKRQGEELRKTLEAENALSKTAEEKFKAGNKVTFEEFKLLIEKGKIKLGS